MDVGNEIKLLSTHTLQMYATSSATTNANTKRIAPSPARRSGPPLLPLFEMMPAESPASGKCTVMGTLEFFGGVPLSVAITARLAMPLYPEFKIMLRICFQYCLINL